jgi:hypothetical protein
MTVRRATSDRPAALFPVRTKPWRWIPFNVDDHLSIVNDHNIALVLHSALGGNVRTPDTRGK